MWAGIIVIFTVWIAARQVIRRRDERLDASARLVARQRIRSRALAKEPQRLRRLRPIRLALKTDPDVNHAGAAQRCLALLGLWQPNLLGWRTVTAEDALITFLTGSLGAKRERVLDFVRRPSARSKFLELLYHQLGSLFRNENIAQQLPTRVWQQPVFRFMPPRDFGLPIHALRDAHAQQLSNELLVTADGAFGYWRDETLVDSEILIIASGPRVYQ